MAGGEELEYAEPEREWSGREVRVEISMDWPE
jgi:hypothetical protein